MRAVVTKRLILAAAVAVTAGVLILGWLFAGFGTPYAAGLLLLYSTMLLWPTSHVRLRRKHLAFAQQHVPELVHTIQAIEGDVRRREMAARKLYRELRSHHDNYSLLHRLQEQKEFEKSYLVHDPELERWLRDIHLLRTEQEKLYRCAQGAYLADRKIRLSPVKTEANKQHLDEARAAAARSQKVLEDLQGKPNSGAIAANDE